MRITIDSEEAGQLKTSLTAGAAADAAVDAGPAPIDHIRRLSKVLAASEEEASEGVDVASSTGPHDPHEKTPLNPLRAGAAAARRKVRSLAEGAEGADAPAVTTTDGGRAAHLARDKSPAAAPDAAAPAAPAAKRGKPRAKR